ncbi:MAG TPA: phospholipase D family protein [Arenimonas sp.]|nr:phospholipase D family protein [Arenimonas sp.]
MNIWRRGAGLALLVLSVLSGCAHLTPAERRTAVEIAERHRSHAIDCDREDACAVDSPLRQRAAAVVATSTEDMPRHLALLLDRGPDALLARVHLIRSAKRSIALQSFIFEYDDSGALVLGELLAAARRGVRVRLLLDQLYGLPSPSLQAALASAHRNFELRLYNPTLGEARTRPLEFAAGIVCCFRRFNQRMHSKLLLVDDEIGLTGGRNIQDRYFDWNPGFNYRDRDVLLAGPAVAAMARNFETFWRHPRAVPAEGLADVARRLLAQDGPPPVLPDPDRERPPRVRELHALAGNGAEVDRLLAPMALAVGPVSFYGDSPDKHELDEPQAERASRALRRLLAGTERELLVQTPYLVLSRSARRVFRELQKREAPPTVWISTNSLASTDAFPVYAMSHKFKRLYLRELGFRIREYKPYPKDTPINVAATGALGPDLVRLPMFGSASAGSASGPVPLRRAGVRVGLHAKSLVIDRRIGIVGSHNLDPRSDHLNTESLVVVYDAGFAEALEAAIRHDMQPENAWTIAPKAKPPILSGLNYSLGKLSEKLPVFDLWPFPYASSFELVEGCMPVEPEHAKFRECYRHVGDFPEVDLPSKAIYTRILTAFGAGLLPIL